MRRLRILVVDDDDIHWTRVLPLRERLASHYDVEIEYAPNGIVGQEKFLSGEPFSYVLVDVHMPELGGLEMLDALAARDPGRLRAAVVFVITTEAAASLRQRGRELGVDAWLVKPVRLQTLVDHFMGQAA